MDNHKELGHAMADDNVKALGTCQYSGIPHPICEWCKNWKPFWKPEVKHA